MMRGRSLRLSCFAYATLCVAFGCGTGSGGAGDEPETGDIAAEDTADGQASASDASDVVDGGGGLDASDEGGPADASAEETTGESDEGASLDGGVEDSQDAGGLADAPGDGGEDPDAPEQQGVPLPTGQLCCSVAAGDEPTLCPIRIARRSKNDPLPCALQLTLSWDAERFEVTGFSDTWCFDDQCYPLSVPPNGLSPSGHSMAIAPLSIENWAGQGSIIATSLTAPIPPITDAHYDGSATLVGDAQVVDMGVRRKPASTTGEVCFSVSGLTIADGDALTLGGYAADSTLVTFGAR